MTIVYVLESMRPQQWLKNFFIFAPLIFSQNVTDLVLFKKALLAFAIFCLLSGSVYILNDLKDIEEDKLHPLKSKRPIASNKLKRSYAIIAFVVVCVICFLLCLL